MFKPAGFTPAFTTKIFGTCKGAKDFCCIIKYLF